MIMFPGIVLRKKNTSVIVLDLNEIRLQLFGQSVRRRWENFKLSVPSNLTEINFIV